MMARRGKPLSFQDITTKEPNASANLAFVGNGAHPGAAFSEYLHPKHTAIGLSNSPIAMGDAANLVGKEPTHNHSISIP